MLEADVLAQPEVVAGLLEVAGELVALAEALGPVVPEEAVGVQGGRDVDARAGITVLPPGAADLFVLLKDREGDAAALECDRGAQAREAGADDQDRELAAGGTSLHGLVTLEAQV